VEHDLQAVKQTQSEHGKILTEHGTILAEHKTMLEAVVAGQKELQETVATQADVQDLKAEVVKKIKQHDKRLDAVEEKEGLTNPYKN